MATDDDGNRFSEIEILQSMFTDDELGFPDPEDLYRFVLKLSIDTDDGSEPVKCELEVQLPEGYPLTPAHFSISCERVQRKQNERMRKKLIEYCSELGEEEMQVLPGVDWLREHACEFFKEDAAPSSIEEKPVALRGFMREWCSFVSLYKDSYISGPNRFEVMTALAKDRGLKITGMGIAGKPGGLVCEGEENDVVEFMELMRTEFFETLNPRGRKLTTRLQERWPLDQEQDRYEAAQIMNRLKEDQYRSKDREADPKTVKFKPGERERLEKLEVDDKAILKTWESKHGRTMDDAEVDKLVEAGPPAQCTTPGVYFKCGCEEPPTREEVETHRVFKDFTIFTGKEGFEASYQDAAKIFKDMDLMYGFDFMFAYRFS